MRTALQDAASIVSILITTEAMIAEKPKDKPQMPMPPGGGMGARGDVKPRGHSLLALGLS
jgi:chaperonin GroEL